MPTLSSHIVKREVASVHDVDEALARQAQYGGDLVTNLLEFASVSEERLARVIAESVGLEPAPPGELPAAQDRVRRLVSGDVALRYGLYPLEEREGKLVVAVSEPLPSEVASDLEFSLGLGLVQRATTLIRVQQAVARDYGLRLDRRVTRLLARLKGDQDPDPSIVPGPQPAALPSREPTLAPPAPELPSPTGEARTEGLAPPPTAGKPPASAHVDWRAVARAQQPAERQRRRLGPYTAAMAELDLLEAETRDDVVAAFFDFAAQYFEYSALFAVHGDLAEGRDAHGSGAPRAKVQAVGVPLDLPSTLSSVAASDPYRLARLSTSGLDGALAKDLERRPGSVVLLLPIRMRDRTVLILYADHGESDVQLEAVGDVISFAPLVATALERVILKRKGREGKRGLPTTGLAPRERFRAQRANLPNKHDRASALASALVEAPLRAASISDLPPEPSSPPPRAAARAPSPAESAPAPAPRAEPAPLPGAEPPPASRAAPLSAPSSRSGETAAIAPPSSLARPMISIGPSRTAVREDEAIPSAPRAPRDAKATSAPRALPTWNGPRSGPPVSRTPIPSSFAPGAPPHTPAPISRKPLPEDDAADADWEAPAPAAALPPVAAISSAPSSRAAIGVMSPSPPPPGSLSPAAPIAISKPPAAASPSAPVAASPSAPVAASPSAPVAASPSPPVSISKPPIVISAPVALSPSPLPVAPRPHSLTPVQMPPPPPNPVDPALFAASTPRSVRPQPPRPTPRPAAQPTPEPRKLELVPEGEDDEPDLEASELIVLNADVLEDISEEPTVSSRAPRSRSVAHSARPLPPPGHSVELRLPTVIVDLAHDTEELVERLIQGERAAAERLVEIGAASVPALVGAFPGPITSELRRGVGDGPPRASQCGPVLEVLARIGPKAAGVLSVRTNDRNPAVRAWSTRLLGEMPCMDAAHAVARRFIDEDSEVRRAALAAGRMLQSHTASSNVLAGTLAEMLLDGSRNEALVHMVIEALADLREARAIPTLATLLATASPEIQRSAHWALVVLARTDYADNAAAWDQWWRENAARHRIEWLIDALMHESPEIRRAAGDELKSLTKEYFGYYDDLPARERERAQHRYREWWETKGKARFG